MHPAGCQKPLFCFPEGGGIARLSFVLCPPTGACFLFVFLLTSSLRRTHKESAAEWRLSIGLAPSTLRVHLDLPGISPFPEVYDSAECNPFNIILNSYLPFPYQPLSTPTLMPPLPPSSRLELPTWYSRCWWDKLISPASFYPAGVADCHLLLCFSPTGEIVFARQVSPIWYFLEGPNFYFVPSIGVVKFPGGRLDFCKFSLGPQVLSAPAPA